MRKFREKAKFLYLQRAPKVVSGLEVVIYLGGGTNGGLMVVPELNIFSFIFIYVPILIRCNANLCLLLKEGHHLSFALNKNLGYVMILTLE